MRLPRTPSRKAIAVGAAMLLLAAAGVRSAFAQNRASPESPREAAMWATLRRATPTVCASLRMADCSGYPSKPCRDYLIEALGYRLPGLNPTKLVVTDLDRHKVIFVDRDVYGFLYMFPLNQWGNLLATVWGSGTTNGIVEIYQLDGDSVKRVFHKGSRFSPQFVAGSEGTPDPVVMLGRYGGGAAMVPNSAEIWQWKPAAGRFVLRATVPAEEKFLALAKLEHEGTAK